MIETVFSVRGDPGANCELSRLTRHRRRDPFDPAAVALVVTLSSRILRLSLARQYPELAALAHWFRPAQLKSLEDQCRPLGGALRVRPRGLVFVMAPANVEVLFIYGWLLSLLCGNGSIVRVSQRPNPAREVFLALVHELVADEILAPALSDSWLITYGHDDAITARISAICDARLVWGGDATVSHVRSIALKPVAVEAAFADRFSFAVFSAEQMLSEDEPTLLDLARRFANDTLWFGQQACSSPRAVVWIGDARASQLARERFWPAYEAAAITFQNEPAAVISRVTDLFMLAAVGAIDRLGAPLAAFPGRAAGHSALAELREIHSGHGMFVEYDLPSLAEVASLMDDKDQTLVVHGFRDDEVEALVRALPNRAVDRIVTPGQATDFATVWDGADLFDVLTRKVSVAQRRRSRLAPI
jgi:hypothetical protein